MKNLADFLFEFIQQPSLLTKISFLKNEAGFEDMQFLFFSKKTLVKSLGIHSFSYVDKKSLDFDYVDSIIEDQDDEIYLNSNETIAVSITIESKSIGFITAPTILNSKETKVVLKTLKKLIESELIQKKLESQLRDRNKELSYKLLEIESLIDVTNIINDQDSELEILFENLLITILSTLNASKGMILLKDPKTDFFNVSSSFNLSKEELPSKIIRITKGVLKDINETKKSLIIDNPEEYPLLKFSKKNILISPLINQNELVGVILLADKESRAGLERFIQQELRLFDNLSKKVSLAYDNIRLIDSLQSSNKLVDNIMTSITTGIIKINVLGELEYVNHSAKKIFGFEEELILNNHYFMVFQKNPHLVNLIEKAENDTNKVLQEENVKIENELDESHEVNLTLSTVYDENNNPSGLVFSFEDLSGINKIKSTFKKYVSENIVDELLKNETSLELGGSQNEVCILFCDIRGFTSMSEKMKPNEVVYLLNHYFDAMIEVVFNHNGTLDKIIGDELMVLYGVPLKNENDAQGAVNSAIAMFEALKKFNIEMEQQNYPALEIGIGINYGKVVCGNIGSERQMNYTVIGDHVNLAARLCSHAKPGEIVISSSVIEKLSSKEGFIQQKPIFVKGKKNEIPIWILKAET
jgi:PAS domain S-box-containing protein